MSRRRVSLMCLLFAAAMLRAQAPKAEEPALPPEEGHAEAGQISPDQLPPEEDKAKTEEHYAFNPVRSKKEVTVGEFYFRKGAFISAANRFREATKWNDGNAEAWLRLGDTAEKMKDVKVAREAWGKYLELSPEAKNAAEVKKKLEKMK